ncbi:MAG: DinB family protein [Cytophagaceae bacterium]|nr:DinB family protein [Cytophagaceae bacterium]
MKISRKQALKTTLAGMVSIPAVARNHHSNKSQDFINEFSEAWKSSRDYTLKVFNQMPEEKFEYKYTPESFSFRTQFVHCITFNAAQLCGRLNLKNPNETKKKEYWSKLTKVELEAELNNFYDWVEKTLKDLPEKTLEKEEAYAGGNIPVWRLFYALENHIIHHRGQAICYLRLNGITPIGYIGW